jgi:hypothetical protein
MSSAITGSNTVTIQINGGNVYTHSAPNYCDAGYTPIIGTNQNSLEVISMDMATILRGIFNGAPQTADEMYPSTPIPNTQILQQQNVAPSSVPPPPSNIMAPNSAPAPAPAPASTVPSGTFFN